MSMTMASSTRGALLILRSSAAAAAVVPSHSRKFVLSHKPTRLFARNFASRAAGGLPSPDIPGLAQTARISLTQQEVEEVGPKIQQVIEWFGQLQAVDLESVEPAIRAETEGDNLRTDVPKVFENREAMIASIPSYEEPYIKVPKVLNKE